MERKQYSSNKHYVEEATMATRAVHVSFEIWPFRVEDKKKAVLGRVIVSLSIPLRMAWRNLYNIISLWYSGCN